MPRPRTPLLDRSRIAEAALVLANETGDLSVTKLAKKLNVAPSALYHHVNGRAEIVALMRERMARLVTTDAFLTDERWQDALREWASTYREAFAQWPGIVRLMSSEPVTDPVLHAMYENVLAGLERAGFDSEMVLTIVTAIENYVLGSVLDLDAPHVMVDQVDDEVRPVLSRAVRSLPRGRRRADQAFTLGLDALIAGLEAVLAQD